MTQRLSEIDKAALANARQARREEAKTRGVGGRHGSLSEIDKGLLKCAKEAARQEAKDRGVGGWRK